MGPTFFKCFLSAFARIEIVSRKVCVTAIRYLYRPCKIFSWNSTRDAVNGQLVPVPLTAAGWIPYPSCVHRTTVGLCAEENTPTTCNKRLKPTWCCGLTIFRPGIGMRSIAMSVCRSVRRDISRSKSAVARSCYGGVATCCVPVLPVFVDAVLL